MNTPLYPQIAPRSVPLIDLANVVNGQIAGLGSVWVWRIVFDSREVQPGDLFVALRGGDFDGHRYLDQAVKAGASAVLVESLPENFPIPSIVVPNSRQALAGIANQFYGSPSHELRTIGITGTDGKTTTSFLINHLLREAGQTTGLIGTVGIQVGPEREYHLPHQTTPESSLTQGFLREMVEQGVETAILEATSHGLALYRLDHVAFDIAAVTNITHEHLEYHGTIENYRRAKAILVERTAANGGVVILNADDEGAMSLLPYAKGASKVVTFSATGAEADLRATETQLSASGTVFTLHHENRQWAVLSALVGDFNVANALTALAVAAAAGVPLDTSVPLLRSAPGVPGRMERVDVGQPFEVMVDYAHTPESLQKILELLRQVNPDGRLIVVTGSAGERDRTKRPLQGTVCARLADLSIFANEDPRNEPAAQILDEIAEGAIQAGGRDGESFLKIVDRSEAIAEAFNRALPGDVVLLAGKGHETSIVIGYEHVPWNERQVAIDLLTELRR